MSTYMADYFRKQFDNIIRADSRTRLFDDGLLLYGNPLGAQIQKCIKAGDFDSMVIAVKQDAAGPGKSYEEARMRVIE